MGELRCRADCVHLDGTVGLKLLGRVAAHRWLADCSFLAGVNALAAAAAAAMLVTSHASICRHPIVSMLGGSSNAISNNGIERLAICSLGAATIPADSTTASDGNCALHATLQRRTHIWRHSRRRLIMV